MSEQSNSRYRKQRFPGLERRKLSVPSNPGNILEGLESEEDSLCVSKRPRFSTSAVPVRTKSFRPVKPEAKDTVFASRIDKRARDEHNEQERSRRRELAVIYELIRCSFSEDDLRYLDSCNGGGPKSIDKLSYPQVLQIAYQLSREEQHNLILFEKCLNNLKIIEKEYARAGLTVPERPTYPSIIDNYRKVVQIVDNLLRLDKTARSVDGVYEMTPSERAALGDQELSFLRPRHPYHQHHSYSNYVRDIRPASVVYDVQSDVHNSWYSSTVPGNRLRKRLSTASLDSHDLFANRRHQTYRLWSDAIDSPPDENDVHFDGVVDDEGILFDDAFLVEH